MEIKKISDMNSLVQQLQKTKSKEKIWPRENKHLYGVQVIEMENNCQTFMRV